MLRKFSYTIVFILMFLALDWVIIGNTRFTEMYAIASPCKKMGVINDIKGGFIERKQPGGKWQRITKKTILCYGDILKTTSNPNQKATAVIQCVNRNQPEPRIAANQITGVANICFDGARPLNHKPNGLAGA